MKYFHKISGGILSLLVVLFVASCGSSSQTNSNDDQNNTQGEVTQDDIIHDYQIDLLKNEVYHFPANTPNNDEVVFQPLKQFDFIFVGHHSEDNNTGEPIQIATDIIPGTYTHMLMYIGKDSNGLAYGVEMNVNEDAELRVDPNGIYIDGQIYVYCLGSDYTKECPKDEYVWGLETYEYMWAKRVDSMLHEQLMEHQKELIATVKNDLQNKFPFELPIGFEYLNKTIDLINDGRKNGADCTAYMTLLFEEAARVCMDDIHMDADAMTDYYINDPRGQAVHLPAEHNPYSVQDIFISDLLTEEGFSIINNRPLRQTVCPDERRVEGIPTPDKIFHSPSMVEITAGS